MKHRCPLCNELASDAVGALCPACKALQRVRRKFPPRKPGEHRKLPGGGDTRDMRRTVKILEGGDA